MHEITSPELRSEPSEFPVQEIDFIPAEQAAIIAEIYAGTTSLEESTA